MSDDTKIRIRDVRVGDMLDLQDDSVADPDGDNAHFEHEYVRVEAVEYETPVCTVLFLDGVDAFGFMPDHEVLVGRRGPEVRGADDGLRPASPEDDAAFRTARPDLPDWVRVVRRGTDNALGALAAIPGTANPEAASRDTHEAASARAETSELAAEANEALEGLDAWVHVGAEGAEVRAFMPEGSALLDRLAEIPSLFASPGPQVR